MQENPSTLSGTIKIMEKLQENVPRRPDGTFHVVATHGDGLSVENMVSAKRARSADLSDFDRLEGLVPIPQEFHHRGLMLQVINVAGNPTCYITNKKYRGKLLIFPICQIVCIYISFFLTANYERILQGAEHL